MSNMANLGQTRRVQRRRASREETLDLAPVDAASLDWWHTLCLLGVVGSTDHELANHARLLSRNAKFGKQCKYALPPLKRIVHLERLFFVIPPA